MPNIIDATGLTVDTAAENTSIMTAGLEGIYGADINVDQNSPDGQMVGIFVSMVTDLLETLLGLYNSFDPDQAVGTLLDQRCAINNIQREGGTYTIQPISITVNASVTLQGLDANFNNPLGTGYTIQDGSGNQFILQNTTALTSGTTVCDFRSADIGPVILPLNTITIPVTIVLGVTGVTNASAPLTDGEIEETDQQLRIRRQQSVALGSSGYANGLLGAIGNLAGVTEARLLQNRTGTTDGNGTLAHTMWLIIAGGASSDIGNTIYNRLSDGCGMRGVQSYDITQPDGTIFVALWDEPIAEPLYIEFTIKTTVAGFSFNQAAIKAYMAANLTYGIGAFADTSEITIAAIAAIAGQGGGGVPVLMQISTDDATWTDYVTTTSPQYQFTVAAANIAITVI